MTKLTVSICIPAYNEEKNIDRLLNALKNQKTNKIIIKDIVIVSSASTDGTVKIAKKYIRLNKRFRLIEQSQRLGKVSAINAFLSTTTSDVVVIQSADTLPKENTIENLCKGFLTNQFLGLTGGSPYPTNKSNHFVGYIVHIWWWLHRNMPRYGEIIAFKNIIKELPVDVPVDEAYIQAWFEKGGYQLKIIKNAVIYNKGPETVSDLIIQRRRVYNGHTRLKEQIGYKVDSFNIKAAKKLITSYPLRRKKEVLWIIGGISIEILSRLLGIYDLYIKNDNPYIWTQAKSTKKLLKIT